MPRITRIPDGFWRLILKGNLATVDRALITDRISRTFSLRLSHDILGLVSRISLFGRTMCRSKISFLLLWLILVFCYETIMKLFEKKKKKKEKQIVVLSIGCEFVELYGSP